MPVFICGSNDFLRFYIKNIDKENSIRSKTRVIELEQNQKLIDIDLDNGELWYITRPMTEDDNAQSYTYLEYVGEHEVCDKVIVSVVETKR